MDDFKKAADDLGVSIAVIRAIAEVESSGSGFDTRGNIKLLFEGHIFYKYLKSAGYNADEIAIRLPNICYKNWADRGNAYKKDQNEQLKTAIAIDEEIAFKSASYGMFQLMGFNHKACGFNSAKAMYISFSVNEMSQLMGFCAFIKSNKNLLSAARSTDWVKFAKIYNGPAYAQNKYDRKLAAAYKKYS